MHQPLHHSKEGRIWLEHGERSEIESKGAPFANSEITYPAQFYGEPGARFLFVSQAKIWEKSLFGPIFVESRASFTFGIRTPLCSDPFWMNPGPASRATVETISVRGRFCWIRDRVPFCQLRQISKTLCPAPCISNPGPGSSRPVSISPYSDPDTIEIGSGYWDQQHLFSSFAPTRHRFII